jgi:pimeloyl-ACP methyl ester carboxylesterase
VPLPTRLQDPFLIIYLHGFASSAHSGKATYLGSRLRARGEEVVTPDLNLPDFSTLTVTRMLEQTRALIERAPAPVTIVGSSLGGYVAVNAAAAWPDRVGRLVLLAPALDFSEDGLSGPQGSNLGEWQRAGEIHVFHYGYGRMLPIHYGLYEDARRYDAMRAEVRMPVLVFQGRRDTAVSPVTVERWASARPNVQLHLLDDDHQLAASLPFIWETLAEFLATPDPRPPV